MELAHEIGVILTADRRHRPLGSALPQITVTLRTALAVDSASPPETVRIAMLGVGIAGLRGEVSAQIGE